MFAFGVFFPRRAKWTRVRKMKTCPKWNSQHLTNLRLREDQPTGTLCSRDDLLLSGLESLAAVSEFNGNVLLNESDKAQITMT